MKLSQLNSQFKKLEEVMETFNYSNFSITRDEKFNMDIQFQDGEKYHLPIIPFRPHQVETQVALYRDGIKRFFLVRPRRTGKEVESWNLLLEGAIEFPGLYMMIYPTNVRARMVLWEGSIILQNGQSLKFLDMIPDRFKLIINQQEMSIKLTNGSIIRVLGSDIDPDKLRGTNPRGVVLSEFAYSDPRVLDILRPVLRQNEGWLILQTTFNGMNHAYRLMKEVKNNPKWFCKVDSIDTLKDEKGNRYVTDEMIDEERKSGMPEFLIQQEYYSSVQINQETIYFSKEINNLYENNRIISGLMLNNSLVYSAWDIGINDCTALILFQLDHKDDPVIVDYYESNNNKLEHYINYINNFCNKHNLVFHSDYLPHDGQKRDFNTGKNTVDFGRDFGHRMYVVPKPTSKINAIQQSRQTLYKTRFNKENTVRLIDCLSNYSKEFDVKHNIYKNSPIHDWTSHGVDAFQTMSLALASNMIHSDISHEIIYYTN